MNIAGNTSILVKVSDSSRPSITRICSHIFNAALHAAKNRGADLVVFDPSSGSEIHLSAKNPTWSDAARLIRQGKKVIASVAVRKTAKKETTESASKPAKRVRKSATRNETLSV